MNLPKILLVDDDPLTTEIIQSSLADQYEIVCESNAEAGLKKASDLCPDLILMDIMMPGMSGTEASRHLKTHPTTQHVPLLIISSIEKEFASLYDGVVHADDFIKKPVDIDQLQQRIQHVLSSAGHQDGNTK